MKYWLFFFLLFMQAQMVFGNRYEANFIDHMMGLSKDTSLMTELAQKKSANLDLKRVARKIHRANKAEMKNLERWRNKYFEHIPELWLMPAGELGKLEKLQGIDFDLQFIETMINAYRVNERRLLEAAKRSEKSFIKNYIEGRRKFFQQEILILEKLKQEILVTD